MAALFDRRVRLTIGQEPPTGNFVQQMPTATVITGLRVQFRIERHLRPEPQKAAVVVYNLSGKSRGQLVGRGLRVVLEAGYPDSLAVIYAGHTRFTDHPKEGVDWVSKFECGTNERELQFARVSANFKPGASVGDLIKTCVGALVSDPGNALQKASQLTQSFASGYATSGLASEELTRLLEPLDLGWSIQDGRMQILGTKEVLSDQPVTLDAEHGLIGTPELGSPIVKGGPSLVKMKSLLQAQFAPGRRVLLNSQARSGLFKILSMAHIGDTDGGDWYTEMEGLPI